LIKLRRSESTPPDERLPSILQEAWVSCE